MTLVVSAREPVKIQGAHWALAYVGKPWTETENCWYWFRRVQAEVFGVRVPAFGEVSGDDIPAQVRLFHSAAERSNWFPSEPPYRDGDAVLMSLRKAAHHIGVMAVVGHRPHVLHGVEGMGVVVTDLERLPWLGWRLRGVYRHVDRRSSD